MYENGQGGILKFCDLCKMNAIFLNCIRIRTKTNKLKCDIERKFGSSIKKKLKKKAKFYILHVLLLHGQATESAFPNEIPFCGSFSYVVDCDALLQSFISVPCSSMTISIIIIHAFAPIVSLICPTV
jgi:hypothetical protein